MRTLIASLLSTSALLGAITIAGCAMTGNITADSAAFATQVQAFNQKAATDISAAAAGGIVVTKAAGQSACGAASMTDGLFRQVAATGAIPAADVSSEDGVFSAVKIACNILDAADASTPVASITGAALSVITALPAIQAALKNGAPAQAAIALAPAPSAS